jgi:hypothetical protein
LRLSEKFILLLILSAFITLCFGAFFFLPDSSKHKRFDLGLEDVLIPHVDAGKGAKNPGVFLIHGPDEHRHRFVCYLNYGTSFWESKVQFTAFLSLPPPPPAPVNDQGVERCWFRAAWVEPYIDWKDS